MTSARALQFFLAIDAARRVAGRTEDEHTGIGRDGGFQLLGRHLEVLLEACLDDHGFAACQQYHLGVAHPVGGGDDDFLTVVDEGHHCIADTLLGTVGDQDLGGGVVQVVLALQLAGYGLSQGRVARYRGVFRIVLVDGELCLLLDVVWGVEVWFSDAHVDYVDTLCLHL